MSRIVNKSNFIIEAELADNQIKDWERMLTLDFIILVNWKIVKFTERYFTDILWLELVKEDWYIYFTTLRVLYSMWYVIPEIKDWYVSEDECFSQKYIKDFLKSQLPTPTEEN